MGAIESMVSVMDRLVDWYGFDTLWVRLKEAEMKVEQTIKESFDTLWVRLKE